MPTVLRRPSEGTPGIITVTHNEALWGVPAVSRRVQSLLTRNANDGRWVYGVHVQGDCTFLRSWPLHPWQSFVMWPDSDAAFLGNLSSEQRIGLNCINFMPAEYSTTIDVPAVTDVAVISRPASIKGIRSTLEIVHELLTVRTQSNVTIIVPDPRLWRTRRRAPKGTDMSFFETARRTFTSAQLQRISFVSSSQEAFGQFPLSQATMIQLLASSRIVLLNSESEGTPRALAEGLLLGKPCAVPSILTTGLDKHLNDSNCLRLPASTREAAVILSSALGSMEFFDVDRTLMRQAFSEAVHVPMLKKSLSRSFGTAPETSWELEDLHVRLACHGEKLNYQIMNSEKAFLHWMGRVEEACQKNLTMDEDYLFPPDRPMDKPRFRTPVVRQVGRLRRRLR